MRRILIPARVRTVGRTTGVDEQISEEFASKKCQTRRSVASCPSRMASNPVAFPIPSIPLRPTVSPARICREHVFVCSRTRPGVILDITLLTWSLLSSSSSRENTASASHVECYTVTPVHLRICVIRATPTVYALRQDLFSQCGGPQARPHT